MQPQLIESLGGLICQDGSRAPTDLFAAGIGRAAAKDVNSAMEWSTVFGDSRIGEIEIANDYLRGRGRLCVYRIRGRGGIRRLNALRCDFNRGSAGQ
jgi:hypothetical protein